MKLKTEIMKHSLVTFCLIILLSLGLVAKEAIIPVITPSTFTPQTSITVSFDVTGTTLADLDAAYIWVWIPGGTAATKYNFNPASSNTAASDKAKFQKSTENDKTVFSITFKPENFFSDPICLETKLGMLIKGNDWANGQSEDFEATMIPLTSCFVVNLLLPTTNPAFIPPNDDLTVSATSSDLATYTLTINGQQVDQQSAKTSYTYQYVVPQVEGLVPVALNVKDAENDTTITFSYLINTPSDEIARPVGIVPGINYQEDKTKATLCAWAPGKAASYVLGEFNDFEIDPANKMNRDGEYFWTEITGLTAGQEYAFQYLIDGVYIADPFADKILDPDDFGIPTSSYPNLKSYPNAGKHNEWFKNRLSIIQTNQTPFEWQAANYQKPAKKDLVIYELLMRDFLTPSERNYEKLIDKIGYLKELGINAIELMPIQEFGGNDSWGYNPQFMFAADKAYGTKQALKKFIDAAHAEGIAVILDIVFNQQDTPNPFLSLWFDYVNFKVKPENPMFNVTAKHPYNVFFDLNHESLMTQHYVDTTLQYWIKEYNVDGYRFDLSKGFTQTNSGDNVGNWGKYDQSRVDILTRMYDAVREYSSDSYLILEHFAENSEEKALADHGFMLWGNMHWDYKDLAKGVGKNIAWGYYGFRGWQQANLVTYMESHDEERVMVEILTEQSNGQLIKDDRSNPAKIASALNRVKQAQAFFYNIPGAKMLWQYGEVGYDISINECGDGSYSGDGGCRTSSKPLKPDYFIQPERKQLYDFTKALINLKTTYSVFETGDFFMTDGNELIKQIKLVNKDGIAAPTTADEMSVYVIGNFDKVKKTINIELPFAGKWYDFFAGGEELNAANTIQSLTLEAGHFKLFVNFSIDFPAAGLGPQVTAVNDKVLESSNMTFFPNPASDVLHINILQSAHSSLTVEVLDLSGRTIMATQINASDLDISHLNRGVYVIKVISNNQRFTQQFIKM